MNRRNLCALAVAGGAMALAGGAWAQSTWVAYKNDFEGAIGNEWSIKTTSATRGLTRFLGNFGGPTHAHLNAKTEANTEYDLSFDFFAIDSWDGNSVQWGPDSFRVRIANQDKFYETFSNMAMYTQSYHGPALFHMVDMGFAAAADSGYHISIGFKGTGETTDFDFFGYGLQALVDESWGIDNVVLTRIIPFGVETPAPGVGGALAVGGALMAGRRPRRR